MSKRLRITVDTTHETHKLFDDLKTRTDSPTNAEVLRKALHLLHVVVRMQETGSKLLLVTDNETRELVIL